jgi:DNA-directed RNA polymerase subunit RPC12/RpoP
VANNTEIIGTVEIECPKCGHNVSVRKKIKNLMEYATCEKCGEITYKKLNESVLNSAPQVKCTYCNSTDVKKITTASKVGSAALFGIFSVGKLTKEWHCNKCNSNF